MSKTQKLDYALFGAPVIGFQNSKDQMQAVDVTKRVKDGRTKIFTDDERAEAEAHARLTGSYIYDVFARVIRGSRRKVEYFGYAVPK